MDYGQMEEFVNQSTHREIALSPLYQLISLYLDPTLPPNFSSNCPDVPCFSGTQNSLYEDTQAEVGPREAGRSGRAAWGPEGLFSSWARCASLGGPVGGRPASGLGEAASPYGNQPSSWLFRAGEHCYAFVFCVVTFSPSFQNASFLLSQLT